MITELNVETGEIITRPLSQQEFDDVAAEVAQHDAEEAARQQAREDNFNFNGVMLTIAKGFLNHENRIRDLEGSPHITLKQLITALRNL